MNALILGSGAREHALGWKLRSQGECRDIWIHPGNAGTNAHGFKDLGAVRSSGDLITKAQQNSIELVVIGPEQLLEQGLADLFRQKGIRVVGPNKNAALLETSKIFAKNFMVEAGVPTAPSKIFKSFQELVNHSNNKWPWVLKLEGLAAGKGVTIAQSQEDVHSFAEKVWVQLQFGPGPHRVLAEDFIEGHEVSYLGLCDGDSFIPLASATDHKRVFDENKGPNTGGMGAISPSPFISPHLESTIQKTIIAPFLRHLKISGLDFRGVLFVGLMIDSKGKPFVLEFNTRFGDPETQCVLPRLKSSLLTLLVATAERRLKEIALPEWDTKTSVYVVACSEGYPENPRLGDSIFGLENLPSDALVFFSGIAKSEAGLISHGGRVLGVGSLGQNSLDAREKAYALLSKIQWRGIHFRKDIGLYSAISK